MRARSVPGVVLAVAVLVGVAWAAEPTYVGAEKCATCHKRQYSSWQTSVHAGALATAEKGLPDQPYGPACLTCHATGASTEMPGVQCESCHGPGSAYWSMSVMRDRGASVAAGLMEPGQQVCSRCHTGEGHAARVDLSRHLHDPNVVHAFKTAPSH